MMVAGAALAEGAYVRCEGLLGPLSDPDARGAEVRGAEVRGAEVGGAEHGGAEVGGAEVGGADIHRAEIGAEIGSAATLLLARLRREQGWRAEAEVLARGVAAKASAPIGFVARAVLAAVLGDLGRDSEARSRLAELAADGFAGLGPPPGTEKSGPTLTAEHPWMVATGTVAELCWSLSAASTAAELAARLRPYASWPPGTGGSGGREESNGLGEPTATKRVDGLDQEGSVTRALGLLAAAGGDWDPAVAYFDEALARHRAGGLVSLVANTSRDLAAVLRSRGRPGDWERAFDLLDAAELIYRRLGAEVPAEEARAVLRRSGDEHASPPGPVVLAATDQGWEFGPRGQTVALADHPGMAELALLVRNPNRRIDVTDLAALTEPGRWADLEEPATPDGPATPEEPATPQALARAKQFASSNQAAGGPGRWPGGLLEANLARAEVQRLRFEAQGARRMAEEEASAEAGREWGHRLDPGAAGANGRLPAWTSRGWLRVQVVTSIHMGLDHLALAHPSLARHLRHSVETGSFCYYVPNPGVSWVPADPGG
ncbi:MAG: hypothetical protein ACT4OS_12195 [Acidimicrobiales bacterium]